MPKRQWILALGFVIRWIFFLVVFAALYLWAKSSDWSAFETPFAQLTIEKLAGPAASLIVQAVAWTLAFQWAFNRHPDYEEWPLTFVLLLVSAVILGALFFGGYRVWKNRGVAIANARHGSRTQPTTVVIDEWWNLDYAQQGCDTAQCGAFEIDRVRQFERDIQNAFASDQACNRLRLIVFSGPDAPNGKNVSIADYTLTLDFSDDGRARQSWRLTRRSDLHVQDGTGTPSEIAHGSCLIANGTA